MADYKAYHLGLVDGQGAERMENNTAFSRVRSDWFEVNSTDEMNGTSTAAGDTVELARLPAGARVLGVFIINEDWGTDVDLDIGLKASDGSGIIDKAGTVDDPDFFTSAVFDLDTTVRATPTNMVDQNVGYVTKKAVSVYATVVDGGSISVAADKDLNGYVLYAFD